MFGILRILVGVVVGIIAFLFVFKFAKIHLRRWLSIIIILSVILLITILGFVPFENWVYSFKSAEEVYEYYYFSEGKAKLVVEGEQSDFVVGTKDNTSTFLIVPKNPDGWEIGIGSNTKRIVQKLSNGIILYVYQYKDTSDYFITILDTNGGEATVSDEYNTKFFSLERYNNSLEKNFVTYYAHITNLNPQYSVIVNDNKIVLENQ
jgi:energy-coupling factor transporter transmembrane protein EcfT